jgi:hypothetical protein
MRNVFSLINCSRWRASIGSVCTIARQANSGWIESEKAKLLLDDFAVFLKAVGGLSRQLETRHYVSIEQKRGTARCSMV